MMNVIKRKINCTDERLAAAMSLVYCWGRAAYLCHEVLSNLAKMPGQLRTMNVRK
jgi:hypothetical protein